MKEPSLKEETVQSERIQKVNVAGVQIVFKSCCVVEVLEFECGKIDVDGFKGAPALKPHHDANLSSALLAAREPEPR